MDNLEYYVGRFGASSYVEGGGGGRGGTMRAAGVAVGAAGAVTAMPRRRYKGRCSVKYLGQRHSRRHRVQGEKIPTSAGMRID